MDCQVVKEGDRLVSTSLFWSNIFSTHAPRERSGTQSQPTYFISIRALHVESENQWESPQETITISIRAPI